MKIARTEFVIITKDRPTRFLTSTGELTDYFDEALILNNWDEVQEEQNKLDEPDRFDCVKVHINVEV